METREIDRSVPSGWLMLAVEILAIPLLIIWAAVAFPGDSVFAVFLWILAVVTWAICLGGFFTLQPNVSAVLILFGAYKGSTRQEGFRWANPFYKKQKISLRAHNLDNQTIKVNDLDGNPIEISAVVVWRVTDTAKASFDVEHYAEYVAIQTDAALRHMAMAYPYDTEKDDVLSLRGSIDEITTHLRQKVQERVDKAGVSVDEARISHLAYAPEIAGAMLQRQQAGAVVAARRKIVDGAVGMVKMALDELRENGVVELDDERKAAMVSNLMVVLCGDKAAHPVVNAGSLYT